MPVGATIGSSFSNKIIVSVLSAMLVVWVFSMLVPPLIMYLVLYKLLEGRFSCTVT